MRTWRLIISKPASGPENMAADESVFLSAVQNPDYGPVIRIYNWEKPCITMGYFQKHSEFSGSGMEITRRPTGGLAVFHGKDISYSIVAGKADWPHVYNQEETYHKFHTCIKDILISMGFQAEFYPELKQKPPSGNPLCVQTFFPYDLHVKGRKILGSSQRRRGEVLLQQGSVHIDAGKFFGVFSSAARNSFEKCLDIRITDYNFGESETAAMRSLIEEKYKSDTWNKKY
ncbi:MAG: hypothetical protein ABII64_04080 [Elusimicrobiota bacterium]